MSILMSPEGDEQQSALSDADALLQLLLDIGAEDQTQSQSPRLAFLCESLSEAIGPIKPVASLRVSYPNLILLYFSDSLFLSLCFPIKELLVERSDTSDCF